jgi:hypothetical protein
MTGNLQVSRCVRFHLAEERARGGTQGWTAWLTCRSVQVNIPAESGEMGILAQHVPSIEQLKPGLVEVIEEAGGSKQFFCTCAQPLEERWSYRHYQGKGRGKQ